MKHAGVFLALSALVLGACGGGQASAPGEAAASHSPDEELTLTLDTAAIRLGGVRVGTADSLTTISLPVTGAITFDGNRVTHIGARTPGRVVALRVDLGARVDKTDILVELESAEVGQIRAEEQRAEALLRIATENHARERRLEAQGISSRKELLEAEAEMRRAEAELTSARDRLAVLGAGHGTGGHFDVAAPIAGTVVQRNVSVGQMATASDTLLTVADLTRVWIELDVFERDLERVREGQSVAIATDAFPRRTFPGRIVYVGEVLDPARRTVRARVDIPNADGALKPGMFARASIQVDGDGLVFAAVPQAAVQDLGGKRVVFIPGAEVGAFRAVPVEVGQAIDRDRVVILSGLKPGAMVVVAGAFALRSELAKGEIGEHGD